jgi:hypothetical protein
MPWRDRDVMENPLRIEASLPSRNFRSNFLTPGVIFPYVVEQTLAEDKAPRCYGKRSERDRILTVHAYRPARGPDVITGPRAAGRCW